MICAPVKNAAKSKIIAEIEGRDAKGERSCSLAHAAAGGEFIRKYAEKWRVGVVVNLRQMCGEKISSRPSGEKHISGRFELWPG
jgi:hypothetical protein